MTTAKKIYQRAMDYTHERDGKRSVSRHSYATLESAIDNAMSFIEQRPNRMKHEVHHVDIINKETGEVEWSWDEAEGNRAADDEARDTYRAIVERMGELEDMDMEDSAEWKELNAKVKEAYEAYREARRAEL